MTEFVTSDNAIVFFHPKDIRDYLARGAELWATHTANWEPAKICLGATSMKRSVLLSALAKEE